MRKIINQTANFLHPNSWKNKKGQMIFTAQFDKWFMEGLRRGSFNSWERKHGDCC